MAARFQRLFLFFSLCLPSALVAVFVVLGCRWWAFFVTVGLLSAYPAIIAMELALARTLGRRCHRGSLIPQASRRQLVRAWAGEITMGLRLFGWEQPFRIHAEADKVSAAMQGKRGVVLIHGLLCNRGFWNPWMRRFREMDNVPFVAVNLEPLFSSIDVYVPIVEAAVCQLTSVTGKAPILAGHSMGGLVARRWLSEQVLDGRIDRVFTIGTPHAGTWLARFATSRNGREMSIGSRWLQDLQRRSRSQDAGRFTCYYSSCDNVVFPAENAALAGADNRFIAGSAHVELAFRPEVIDEVLAALLDNRPSPEQLAGDGRQGPT